MLIETLPIGRRFRTAGEEPHRTGMLLRLSSSSATVRWDGEIIRELYDSRRGVTRVFRARVHKPQAISLATEVEGTE